MPSSTDRSHDFEEIKQMIADLESTMKGFRNKDIAKLYKKEIDELKMIIDESSTKRIRKS